MYTGSVKSNLNHCYPLQRALPMQTNLDYTSLRTTTATAAAAAAAMLLWLACSTRERLQLEQSYLTSA
jgi:hypothetical protein